MLRRAGWTVVAEKLVSVNQKCKMVNRKIKGKVTPPVDQEGQIVDWKRRERKWKAGELSECCEGLVCKMRIKKCWIDDETPKVGLEWFVK